MNVDISFRNCVLAKRTLCMSMTKYFAEEKNEALLSQLPASSPMSHLGLFSLHATTAKGWHSPAGPRIQQVPLTYTHNRLPCTFLARVLRHAWRSVWQGTITFRSRKTSSEEVESCEEESDLTAAFEREMDELASVVEGLEDTVDVQDVEDLRELSESMYEGLATI